VDLSFRVSSTIISFPVRVGDDVAKDQVVAQLDQRDFEVAIMEAEAGVAVARADVAAREDEFHRVSRAFEADAATEFEVSTSREASNAAQAQLASAQARLEAAKDALSYATLRAPFAGEVTATYVENFEDVLAKEPVMRILDDTRIEMEIYVPEHLIAVAPTAENIRCEFDALPGVVLPAEFKEIGSEADTTTRTFPIRFIMDQPEGGRILPGMTGNAWAVKSPSPPGDDPAFDIPITALGEDVDGSRFVWLVDEQTQTVARRDVEVSEMVLGGVRVRGLARDEIVVTAGASLLREGQQVRLPDLPPPGSGS
jgi:RND family efflux transporter MFP subunit